MKSRFNTRRYFQVLGLTLALILAAVLAVLGIGFAQQNGMLDSEDNNFTVKSTDGKINVLLMGVDNDGLRTDAIMLASYNTETNEVKMLSIPRDTRMYIGSRYQKINAAHALRAENGGVQGAQSTIEAVNRLTGVPINYYVDFSFQAIEECMDLVGPVTFEIPDLYDDGVGMVYDDPVQDLHINLKPGVQELNGEQIVHLLRYRKGNQDPVTKIRKSYKNGDIGRIEVQQEFLKALVDQKLNASLILKLPAMFKQISESVDTNLTVRDVVRYSKYLSDFSSTGIETFSLPGAPSGSKYDASYWICDLEETAQLIESKFGYDASGITIDKRGTNTAGNGEGVKAEPTQKQSGASKATAAATEKAKKTAKPTAKATAKAEATAKGASSTAKATKKPSVTEKPQSGSTKTPVRSTEKPDSESKATKTPERTSVPAKTNPPERTKTPVKETVDDDDDLRDE